MHDYSVHYKSCSNTFSGVTLVHVTQRQKWIGMPLIKGVNDAAIIAMQTNYYHVERVLNLGSAYPGCHGVCPPPIQHMKVSIIIQEYKNLQALRLKYQSARGYRITIL